MPDPVAFLSAEFAIDNDLPIYAGGLGILAADLINAAATAHYPMIGIGIVYKGKEFVQHITGEGKEEKRDSEFDHDASFLRPTTERGNVIEFTIPSPTGPVKVKSYHLRVSDATILFLLSTDVDGNPPEWITDMDALYHGDANSQIRQQILLGVGGARLLEILNIKPKVFHINEGRPEFVIWEIAHQIAKDKEISYEKAWKLAKDKIVYTNHTLVAAGNPHYPLETVKFWAKPFADENKIDVDILIKDGIKGNNFSITDFALNISKKHSAVSKIHGDYTKRDFPDFNWEVITNGVHLNRWQDSDYRKEGVTDKEIWDQHIIKKRELVETVIQRTGFGYDPNRLVVTWARRLAEYKQPKLIFSDIQKLHSILSNSDRPVQLLFAGNSHSADPNAKSLIEEVIKIFANELNGYAIFVPNYNISLANHLTSGSDIWLNTPKGNLEACGTSGMKAISNGVLQCTVLDGWTYEVNWDGIGWVLDPNNVANDFYLKLDTDIAPMFYEKNAEGLPVKWIEKMRRSIELSNRFSAERMLEDYKRLMYV